MHSMQRRYVEREKNRRWGEPKATMSHTKMSQLQEDLSSSSTDTYASSEEDVSVLQNRSVTFPVAKPRAYSQNFASYAKNDQHEPSKNSISHKVTIKEPKDFGVNNGGHYYESEEKHWKGSQYSMRTGTSNTWKYGLMEFYNDIAYTILVMLFPFATEFHLVRMYSGLKLALASLLMFFLPIIVAVVIFIIVYNCWLAPIDMLEVVALLCIFVVITTACLIARTAILGKARKNLRQMYDIDDNRPNDVCTVFCCYPFSLCQMLQEIKHQKFIADRMYIR